MNGNLIGSLMPLIVLFAIFYFLVLRPQQKQQEEHTKMLQELKKGDVVLTNGGLIVEITKVEDSFFSVKSHDGASLRIAKSYIASRWED